MKRNTIISQRILPNGIIEVNFLHHGGFIDVRYLAYQNLPQNVFTVTEFEQAHARQLLLDRKIPLRSVEHLLSVALQVKYLAYLEEWIQADMPSSSQISHRPVPFYEYQIGQSGFSSMDGALYG